MAPKGKAKVVSAKKQQPRITSLLTRHHKRTIACSDDDSDGDVEEEQPIVEEEDAPDTPKRRGRPKKAKEIIVIFDDEYVEVAFSMYISKAKEHIPLIYFHSVCDYLDENMTMHDTSTEKGKREENLHIQSIFTAHILTDDASIKKLVTEIKTVIGVRWGDKSGVKVQIKPLVTGQTIERMIGYVRKDRAMVWFNNRSKNVTQEMIDRGVAEHESLSHSYTDDKIILTKANFFQKIWGYWTNMLAPRIVSMSFVLTVMLNERPQKYMLAGNLLMNNMGQMRRSAAEVYWLLCMGQEITEYEVRQLIFVPKNNFSNKEYMPKETVDPPEVQHTLFGESDEDEENTPASEECAAGPDACGALDAVASGSND